MNTFAKITIGITLILIAIGTYETFYTPASQSASAAKSVVSTVGIIAIVVLFATFIVFFGLVFVRGFLNNNVRRAKNLFDFFVTQRGWKLEPDADSAVLRPRHFLPDTSGYQAYNKAMVSSVASKNVDGKKIWMVYEKYTYRTKSNQVQGLSWKLYIVSRFHKELPGFVRIGPEDNLDAKFKKDLELESIEFNKNVYIVSKPPKLAWSVLPPDFMEWYLRLSAKPWVMVEGNVCSVDIRDTPSLQLVDECIDHTLQIAEFVEKSGALEREPAGG